MIDLKQQELKQWELRNFGKQELYRRVLGMTEEVGEICHHVLKGEQKIRGGVDGINKKEVADRVADVFIYGINLLTELGIDAESVVSRTINDVLKRDWKKNPGGGDKCIQ